MFEHCNAKIQKILLMKRRAFYSFSIEKQKMSKGAGQSLFFALSASQYVTSTRKEL